MSWIELIQAKLTSFVWAEPSRVYTSMSYLIYERIIVFTNDSFIFRTYTKLSLSKPSRTEFTSRQAHLTPLIKVDEMLNYIQEVHDHEQSNKK